MNFWVLGAFLYLCIYIFPGFDLTRQEICVNFTYQRNGLNIDVTLSSDILRTRTVANYKPFKFCLFVPGCLFSMACINVLELNRFPRSITGCLRLDIYSKKQLWQINYDCVSISTELPMIPTNATTRTAEATEVPVVQEGTKVDRPLEMPTTITGTSNVASTPFNGTASIDGTTMMSAANATMGMPTEETTPTIEPTTQAATGMINATMAEGSDMEMYHG
ncbi:hypothetical protein KM043_000706 [Ampulex compressa]|nr:hypothetical protein KM043_000706 [Ampulex compressa]